MHATCSRCCFQRDKEQRWRLKRFRFCRERTSVKSETYPESLATQSQMRAKKKKKKIRRRINVVRAVITVCELQGLKVHAVVKQWSREDSRKSKVLKGKGPEPRKRSVMRAKASDDFNKIKAKYPSLFSLRFSKSSKTLLLSAAHCSDCPIL